ncbi:MAG: hypothetical protein MI673_01140 [Thiotrichales bacterium]|nr:hypothetical protein [Thiotrichales bacterium]
MTDKKTDQDLQAYLDGSSDISRAYKEKANERSPQHVDAAILAAARRSVESGPRAAFSPFSSNWHVPASLAAVLVLSVGLVFTVQEQTGEGRIPAPVTGEVLQPEAEAPVPVARQTIAASGDSSMAAKDKALADIARPDEVAEPAVLESLAPMQDLASNAPVSVGKKQLKSEAATERDIPAGEYVISMDTDSTDAEQLITIERSRAARKSAARIPARDAPIEFADEIEALEEEISELKQSRERLEKEKDDLESALQGNTGRRDQLQRQVVHLAGLSPLTEISGTGAQVAWLNHIRRLLQHDQQDLAIGNLADFRRAHPDYPRAGLLRILPADIVTRAYGQPPG